MDDELTEEQKEQALYAARSGILTLLAERPELALLGADDLTTVYLAGVVAGVEAAVAVFQTIGRDL